MSSKKIEWTITRITDGFVYGTVWTPTERGARTVAARTFNDEFRYLSATPVEAAPEAVIVDSIRPTNPDALKRGRVHGSTGVVIDPAKLQEFLDLHHEGWRVDGEMLMLEAITGELAVIGTEGVGVMTEAGAESVKVYALHGLMYDTIEIPIEELIMARTNERADVADFVRIFGDRLDVNAHQWTRFVKNGSNR